VKINVEQNPGTVLLTFSGEIISRSEQQMVSDLIARKLDEGERVFVIDLSEVPYISSLGIAVLVATHVKVSRAGGKLRLVNPRPRVSAVLEMTRISEILTTFDSVEEALRAQ